MSKQEKTVEFSEIVTVAQDYKLLQARNSKGFVQLMVDVCAAINACPMGKLVNLDVDELKNQTGFLLYYQIKGLDDPIPCDVEFITQLYSHFRKPTVIVLRRIQKHLNAGHRRILGRMEREQALERVVNMSEFDVSAKIRNALNEMNRFKAMADLVRGGGRKLDILTQALNVPSRARFELITIDRILRDNYHIRYEEAMKWLNNSKFKSNVNAIFGLIKNGFQMLDSAGNKILDLMEELAGVQFPRDTSAIDLQRNWYSLGNALPRGEEFAKAFTAEEQVEQKIKRLTFPMARVAWDVDRLRNMRDRMLVDLNVVKVQVAQLTNLIFDLEKKILSASKPDGDVMVAILSDFDNGMLSIREREDAEKWAKENRIRLQELMMETFESLKDIKGKHPKVVLSEEIEATINRIKTGLASDRQSHQEEMELSLENMTIKDLVDLVQQLEVKLEHPDAEVLQGLVDALEKVSQRIDQISIKNINFHKQVRDAFQDFSEYENKVLELYKMEEQLEQMRINLEGWLHDSYRVISYVNVSEKTLSRCMDVVIGQMLLSLKKLDFHCIDATMFQTYYDEACKLKEQDRIVHLDQLLQEVEAVPRSEQLINTLKDWEKTLGAADFREKERFVLDNSDKLQLLSEKLRADLREHLSSGGKGLSRRLRFEVFGLSDCLADSLRNLFNGVMSLAERLANDQEGELVVANLQSLEAQVMEAQKSTNSGGDAYTRLTQMLAKETLPKQLVQEMERDLELNFKDLNQLLCDVGAGMKRVKLIQNKFGGNKDTDYLDVTININDIEDLKKVYDFIDGVTLEDTKRFCVSYNLKTALISNIFERALKKDPTVAKEIVQHFTKKNYALFIEKRFIALPLKTAIMKNSKEIFEAECHLLCHTLNLVKGLNIRKKASYQSMMTLLGQAKGADQQVVKTLGLLWGRLQTRLFKFKPVNHEKNYEGNRQAMMSDVKDIFGR